MFPEHKRGKPGDIVEGEEGCGQNPRTLAFLETDGGVRARKKVAECPEKQQETKKALEARRAKTFKEEGTAPRIKILHRPRMFFYRDCWWHSVGQKPACSVDRTGKKSKTLS